MVVHTPTLVIRRAVRRRIIRMGTVRRLPRRIIITIGRLTDRSAADACR